MPLAKSAEPSPIPEVTQPVKSSTPQPGNLEMGTVPFETYRFFGISPGNIPDKDLNQIKDVYDWAKQDSKDLGESLYKIRQLEIKMGQPALGESRYSRMWNYVRMSKAFNTIKANREAEIKRVAQIREAEIKKIKAQKDKRIADIERKKNLEISKIKESHSAELNNIKKLQQAYS